MANYDIIGNIAIIKKEGKTKQEIREEIKELLGKPGIKTILEKAGRIKGKLRTFKIKHLAGDKNTIALYKESMCTFKLDLKSCYFSPRLASDRIYVAGLVKKAKAKKVLCMFSGVAPYPIIIAKIAKPKSIIAVEIGKECCKYAEENARRNKFEGVIKIVQGDVKRIIPKFAEKKEKFDFIVMTRPNLKESFLKYALSVAKKGAKIYYHGFSHENNLQEMIDNLSRDAKKEKKRIKIIDVKKIGELAPYKYRYGVEMKVLN